MKNTTIKFLSKAIYVLPVLSFWGTVKQVLDAIAAAHWY